MTPEEQNTLGQCQARIAELEAALQDKCHGFPETDYVPFCDGCDGYQREKFGKCRTDELERQLAESRKEVERLSSTIRSLSTLEGGTVDEVAEHVHAELEMLRAFVGDELLRPDFQTAADMRAEIEWLKSQYAADMAAPADWRSKIPAKVKAWEDLQAEVATLRAVAERVHQRGYGRG